MKSESPFFDPDQLHRRERSYVKACNLKKKVKKKRGLNEVSQFEGIMTACRLDHNFQQLIDARYLQLARENWYIDR